MNIGKKRIEYCQSSGKWIDSTGRTSGTDENITITGLWRYDSGKKQYYIQTAGKQKIYLTVEDETEMSIVWRNRPEEGREEVMINV